MPQDDFLLGTSTDPCAQNQQYNKLLFSSFPALDFPFQVRSAAGYVPQDDVLPGTSTKPCGAIFWQPLL